MVNRRTASGQPFNTAEAVTPHQALRAYTFGSAYASHAEHVKGTIAPGYLADFTLLSEGPTAVSPDAIAATTVLAAFVGGQCRYDATGRGQLS
jgi:predicted amidohydrolase YtcJ